MKAGIPGIKKISDYEKNNIIAVYTYYSIML